MKVLVVGGYGVFGSRLATLLVRDGHMVFVAGRRLGSARAQCARLSATPVELDSRGPYHVLDAIAPDVVVDAAGPFQRYADDPYRLARAALDAGAHYLDLSDDGAFCEGIVELDDLAKSRQKVALSGASSTPALSGAVLASLTSGFETVHLIETAILPGNRAPRGDSVMRAILSQVGYPLRIWQAGAWRTVSVWTSSRRLKLQGGMHRWASLIGSPELTLLPARFRARSVVFLAGLELGVMHRGLELLSRLRQALSLPNLAGLTRPLRVIATLLARLGTDRGAMRVRTIGETADASVPEERTWTLVAEQGVGPSIPAVPARTLLRNLNNLEPGARPCVTEVTLDDHLEAMQDLAVTTRTETHPAPVLFQAILGEHWSALPVQIKQAHTVFDFARSEGRASVRRGSGWLSRLIGALFGFPGAGADIPVAVTMTREHGKEVWQRRFGTSTFTSHLRPGGPGMCFERFGPFEFHLALPADEHGIGFDVHAGRCLGIPLPRALLPVSKTREYVTDGLFHFDVELRTPLFDDLIVHYRGWLRPDAS